ncbi:hypothetical protein CEP54_002585 [Fusarium duplospermum]|uniref:Uncharacterized protein n=1 Tax=Fusarium duplospermum TaxID=1325734 RepID=A0A428QUN2_9HYPO|nr:hypothetical protein CEP54_002585 [Fusarium duplospermum]
MEGSKIPTPKDEMAKEGDLPWHAQILSYLQFKEVFLSVITVPDPEFEQYMDPPETSFITQFARLQLFLNAGLLKPNGRARLELDEADPGFRKIQMIAELSYWAIREMGYNQEPPVTSFPEEWKDESYFLNWMWVNVFLHLTCLDTNTVEKATHIIMHTNYIQVWNIYGAEHRAYLKNQEIIEASWAAYREYKESKMDKKLERQKKNREERLLKEVRAQRMVAREQNYH